MKSRNINEMGKFFYTLWLLTVIILIGATLNFHAVISNGGRMPIESPHYLETETHFTFQDKDDIKNYYLTDIINIKNLYISIGDLMLGVSLVLMFIVCIHNVITEMRLAKK